MRGNVTNYILGLSVLLMLTSCSSATNENIDIVEEDAAKVIPTVKERDGWLDSNEFVMEYEHTDSTERNGQVYLKVKMNDDFAQKKISEQYLYLIDFYEEYDEKYSKLIPPYSFLNSLDVFFCETEFPTYVVFYATFSFEAVNISIDRETGQRPTNNVLQLLDSLDTAQIISGTHSGLTLSEVEAGMDAPIKGTIITASGEIRGNKGVFSSNVTSNSVAPSSSNTTSDTETYIKGMTGYEWESLTDNQKFHAVSNALYSLDQNGYLIHESEYFYIDALNEFYIDSATIGTPVNEALTSIGVMSNTITEE